MLFFEGLMNRDFSMVAIITFANNCHPKYRKNHIILKTGNYCQNPGICLFIINQ